VWSDASGAASADRLAREYHRRLSQLPEDLLIGDPGPSNMFDDRLYKRGALTLHALRLLLGDVDFFGVLREWTTTHRHATATTADFIELVATRTGHQVGTFFEAWLYGPQLPPLPPAVSATSSRPRH